MLRHLHYLQVRGDDSSSATQPIHMSGKQADLLPIEGMRICFFCHKNPYALSHVGFWIKLLHREPLDWLQPSEAEWRIDLDGAKEALSVNCAVGYRRPDHFMWPTWLCGATQLAPGFEVPLEGQGYPRLVFYLTEWSVAKAKTPPLTSGGDRSLFVNYGAIQMASDTFNNFGQAGAIGKGNVSASGNSFVQAAPSAADAADLAKLANELGMLREAMRLDARETTQFQSLASIASAEDAAMKGDGVVAVGHLKAAGKWALDVATKIGVGVAEKAIQHAIGMP